MAEECDTTGASLRRIADVLQIPVERFYDEAPSVWAADSSEALHLWNSLRTERGRAAALDALRKALDDEG